jgi:hypothetical protein
MHDRQNVQGQFGGVRVIDSDKLDAGFHHGGDESQIVGEAL